MRQLAAIAALWGCVAMAQAASGVALLEDEVLRRNGTAAPLFSFASPTAFRGYPAYAGLPASDGCYAAASVTGTKGEALTFTRATTRFCPTDGTTNEATGVMCSSGQVCIQSLNSKRGISVFRAGTNLALRSEEFDNASWTKISGAGPVVPTVTADSAECGAAPDGTQTAEKVEFPAVSAATSYSILRQSITYAALSTDSVWVKRLSGGSSLYVSNGVLTSNTSRDCAPSAAWSRCSVTSSTSGAGFFDIGTNLNLLDQTSTTAIVVCLWGGDAKSGTYPTPYVATAGASATRNAEVAQFAGRGVGGPMSAAASIVLPSGWVAAGATYATILNNYTSAADYWLIGHLATGPQAGVEAYPGAKRSVSGATGTLSDGRWWAYQDAANLGAGKDSTSFATTTNSAVSNGTLNIGNYAGTSLFLDGLISNVCVDPSPTRCR